MTTYKDRNASCTDAPVVEQLSRYSFPMLETFDNRMHAML